MNTDQKRIGLVRFHPVAVEIGNFHNTFRNRIADQGFNCTSHWKSRLLALGLGNVYIANMTGNDNSVNIKKRSRAYHHGDLRSALIETGLAWLATGQGDDISLREVARLAGVSATAVYRHFPDKQALIGALCERGEANLATAQRSAADAAGGGGPGFGASGQAYVRFALANPGLFRLMMSTRPGAERQTDFLDDKSTAMRGLRDDVAAVLPDSTDAQQRLAAIHAWSLVHGMAMLMLDGMIPPDEALISSISSSQFGAAQAVPGGDAVAAAQNP